MTYLLLRVLCDLRQIPSLVSSSVRCRLLQVTEIPSDHRLSVVSFRVAALGKTFDKSRKGSPDKQYANTMTIRTATVSWVPPMGQALSRDSSHA